MSVSRLHKALEILAFKSGDGDFYQRAAEALSLVYQCRWAAVFSLNPDKLKVRAEAFWCDGSLGDSFEFDLAGTPCGELYNTKQMLTSPLFFSELKKTFPEFDLLDAETYQAALFFDEDGNPAGHIAILSDEPIKQSEQDKEFFLLLAQRIGAEYRKIAASKALRLRSQMIESTPHLMSFVDTQYIYRMVSKGYEDLFGMPIAEIVGKSVEEIQGRERFSKEIKEKLDRCLAGETLHTRIWVPSRKGKSIFADVNQAPCIDEAGEIIGVITSAHDITESKKYEDRIARFAHMDPLTGLPNRRYFYQRVREELAKYRRRGSGAVIFFIDLDGFKEINDSLGHAAGDQVLETIASRLKASIRKEDVLARIGGDEFVVMITGDWNLKTSIADSRALSEKVLKAIAEPIECMGEQLQISASIGIHPIDDKDDSVDDVIRKADMAMYRAKQGGRNQIKTG